MSGPWRALVEGVYALVEWRDGDVVQAPPQVEGRFILKDGLIVTILSNLAAPGGGISVTQYGRFTLDDDRFEYGYDRVANFQHTREGIVALPMLAPGWRGFAVSILPDTVELATDAAAFVFTPAGMTYSEQGICLRRWQRLRSAT